MRFAAGIFCCFALSAQPQLTKFRDLDPILKPCQQCHGLGRMRGSWPTSYYGLMEGAFYRGDFLRIIVPGNAAGSPLIAALEGRIRPHRAKSREEIRLVSDWINAGARADSESAERQVVLDGVPVDAGSLSFWLSCRAGDADLRLKVVNEATGRIVAYDWPTSTRELNGRWSQWKVEIPKDSIQLPGKVTLRLHVAARRDEDLDGVIFLIEPKRTPDAELLKQKDFKSVAMPNPPPHQDVTFRYVLRAPSDVALSVIPEGGGKPLFTRNDRDLPANRVLETPWKLASSPEVISGLYTARFKCTSRKPGVFQPDMAILFRIAR